MSLHSVAGGTDTRRRAMNARGGVIEAKPSRILRGMLAGFDGQMNDLPAMDAQDVAAAPGSTRAPVDMIYPALVTGHTIDELDAATARYLTAGGTTDFGGSAQQRQARAAQQRRQLTLSDRVPEQPTDLRQPASVREHDAYFGVRRVAAAPADGFLRSLVLAHLEAPLDCVAAETGDWDDTPAQLFEGLLKVLSGQAPDGLRLPVPNPADEPDPMTTWAAGHRLFFALEQGAVIGLRAAAAQLIAGSDPAPGLRFAAAFLRSSAAAMRLASAFDPQRYLDEVRPDMAPPKVGAGFSGLHTADHRELVQAMIEWRSAARNSATVPEPQQHVDELVEAVRTVYLSHEFVCARFRGDQLPSLRSAAWADGGRPAPTGVALAKQYTRRRVRLVR